MNFIDVEENFTYWVFDSYKEKQFIQQSLQENGRYLINRSLGLENKLRDINFSYDLNKYGFRTIDLENIDWSKKIILANGCSVTFGLGLPESNTWPMFLSQMINKNDDLAQIINISTPGASIKHVIRNTMTFIKKFGKPDIVIAIMPNISRNIYFFKEDQTFRNVYITDSKHDPYAACKEYEIYYNNETEFFNYMFDIYMLEQYCESNGIKLIWSTWSSHFGSSRQNIKKVSSIRHYEELPYTVDNDMDTKFPNTMNLEWWDYSSDNHPGGGWQHANAEFFYNKIIEKNYL